MMYRINKKKTVLVFTLVLLAFLSQNIYHSGLAIAGPAEDLASRMYEQYKEILTRSDLLPLLPEVLPALKDPKYANPDLYTPIFVYPERLREHLTNVDAPVLGAFIALLQEAPNVQEIFLDADFAGMYGDAAAIDALLVLLKPRTGNQVKIDHGFVNMRDYGTLLMTSSPIQIGDSVGAGTTHTLIFTVIDAERKPVPGLPLNFSLQPLNGTAASGTFNPTTAATDQNGRAHVIVTFGLEPGDLRLLIDVNTQQIVDFVELELTRGNNTRVHKVTVKGIEHKFAPIGTARTLVFTATDPNGKPVEGEELTFGFRSASGSTATATFDPATATSDQNGEARTQITFGPEPGGIHLTVQSGSAVEQVNITSNQVNLGSQVQGTFTGLQVGDSVDVGSTHTLVFTAKDMRGRPVSGLPVAFGGSPLELEAKFDPETATTDRNGKVRTQITFGPEPGDFQLLVSIDPRKVIVFSEPEFSLEATNIATLKVQGMEDGFAEPGSSIKLALTATDARGRPVADEELVFGSGIAPDSRTTAVFKPAKVKTNNRGKAQTRVTFGSEPGEMRLTVKSGVIIHAVSLNLEPYGTLSLKGLQVGDAVKVNSAHDLVFTATNDAGEPVPWLPLRFNALSLDGAEVGTTFEPARVVTNKNGKARTSITLGAVHGDIRLIAEVDSQQIVELLSPKITLDDPKVNRLIFEGIEQEFARVGTTRKLTVTARNKNGKPVSGVNLMFGFRSPPESKATVAFSDTTVTTGKNGQAQTEVTFGDSPGRIRFTVGSLDGITIQAVRSDINISTLTGDLTYQGFTIGDTFQIGSTHTFVFTVTETGGSPIPWLPLKFKAIYLDGTEAEVTFTPATPATNKNGKARTDVSFNGDPGDIRLIAEVDRQQLIEIFTPEVSLDGTGIVNFLIEGADSEFARLGTQRRIVITAADSNGNPVAGVEFTFGFKSEPDSKATATFESETVTTDENGRAQTQVTFGSEPGGLRFIVKPVGKVRIDHVSIEADSDILPFNQLTYEGAETRDAFDVNSTHDFVFTVRRETGRTPVPGLPFRFAVQPLNNSKATVTFDPVEAITDQNGKLETSITFGPESGDIQIIAKVDFKKLVWLFLQGELGIFREDELESTGIDTLEGKILAESHGTGIDTLEGTNLDDPFSRLVQIDTTRTLIFTATDVDGEPVEGAELVFEVESFGPATATFSPATAVTDENGQIQVNLTFGKEVGGIVLIVKPRGHVTIPSVSIDVDHHLLGCSRLLYEGFEINSRFLTSSTHPLVFTALDDNGNPMSGVPIIFRAIPLTLNPTVTFTPVTATTDAEGKARTNITFGTNKGAVHLDASLDTDKAVEIVDTVFTLKGEITSLTLEKIGEGGGNRFAIPNSTHPLVFNASDQGGNLVEGAEIVFGFSRIAGTATARFNPPKATTTSNGKAHTNITFGNSPDEINIHATATPQSLLSQTPDQVTIHSAHLDIGLGSSGLTHEGFEFGDTFDVNSTHTIAFAATDENDNPMPGVPLILAVLPWGLSSTAAGAPSASLKLTNAATDPLVPTRRIEATTNENGKVVIDITFGPNSGALYFIVYLDASKVVRIVDPLFTLHGEVASLTLDYIGEGKNFALPNSTHPLVFTTTDINGGLVQGAELTLGLGNVIDSEASATFAVPTITTDQNGKAQTHVTFGPKYGSVQLTVQAGSEAETPDDRQYIRILDVYTDLSPYGSVRAEGFQVGTVQTGSTRSFIFNATDEDGNPLQHIPLRFETEPATDSTATATFTPPRVITDSNGTARTRIRFGAEAGDIRLRVRTDESRMVEIYEPDFMLAGSKINFKINLRYALLNSTQVLVITAVDENGNPVKHTDIRLQLDSENISASLRNPELMTDENGVARTNITIGSRPGAIQPTIRVRSSLVIDPQERVIYWTKIWDQLAEPLPSSGNFQRFQNQKAFYVGTDVEMGIPYELVFTAMNANGNPWTSVPIKFSGFTTPIPNTEDVTFTSTEETTNEEGVVVTHVTFGSHGTVTNLNANIDSQKFVKVVDITTSGPNIALNFLDIAEGDLILPNSRRAITCQFATVDGHFTPLVFTTPPVSGSRATATFDPTDINTLNHEVKTYITVGSEPGPIRIHVEVRKVQILFNIITDKEPDYGLSDFSFFTVDRLQFNSFNNSFPLNGSVFLNFTAFNRKGVPYVTGDHWSTWVIPETVGGALFTIDVRSSTGNATVDFEPDYIQTQGDLGNGVVTANIGPNPGTVSVTLKPPEKAMIEGKIRMEGTNDDIFVFSRDFSGSANITPYSITSRDEFSTPRKVATFNRHNEIRIEVYLAHSTIHSTGVELAAYVKFFEFGFLKSKNDLDDVRGSVWLERWGYMDINNQVDISVANGDTRRIIPYEHTLASELLNLSRFRLTPEELSSDRAHVYFDLEITPVGFPALSSAAAPKIANLTPLQLDVNADGQVNLTDLILVSNYLGHPAPTTPPVDVNRDGTVTIADLVQVVQHLSQLTRLAAPAQIIMPPELTHKMIQEWIDDARAADDGSLTFRQGIANLELLLTLIVPEKMALLHNYPNPFNPETWIPYHLAEPANVTLTIYSINGKVVRHLDLGHQPAGYYQNKSRAAYWDGRNNVGERVASGIYFYTLTAGGFTATQKLVIRK